MITIRSFTFLALAAVAGRAWSCAICFGDPQSSQNIALRSAVIFMVSITGLVLAGMAALFLKVKRRPSAAEKS